MESPGGDIWQFSPEDTNVWVYSFTDSVFCERCSKTIWEICLFSCRELDERINNTLMLVCSVWRHNQEIINWVLTSCPHTDYQDVWMGHFQYRPSQTTCSLRGKLFKSGWPCTYCNSKHIHDLFCTYINVHADGFGQRGPLNPKVQMATWWIKENEVVIFVVCCPRSPLMGYIPAVPLYAPM